MTPGARGIDHVLPVAKSSPAFQSAPMLRDAIKRCAVVGIAMVVGIFKAMTSGNKLAE